MTAPFTPTWDADEQEWALIDAEGVEVGRYMSLIDAEDVACGTSSWEHVCRIHEGRTDG